MRRRRTLLIGLVAVALLSALVIHFAHRSPRASGSLAQEGYLWQRAWTPAVEDGLRTAAPHLSRVVVLGAEISFKQGQPQTARAAWDLALLKSTGSPIGIALRIGPYPGPFAADDAAGIAVSDAAASLVDAARQAGISPAELQIDFDCAASKLAGYQIWIEAIRKRIAPTPLSITALPSWLDRSTFPPLAASAGEYVLQVHSLDPPTSIDAPMALCDLAKARAAVERAGAIGVPFRVALPTYGYLVAFDSTGKFVGLSAEGPSRLWPSETQVRALRADPGAMAQLIRDWTTSRPAAMRGVIWYRIPSTDDALNWRWPTLAAVMAGRSPTPQLRADVRRTDDGLFDVTLTNRGEADASPSINVTLTWKDAEVLAADGLGGFACAASGVVDGVHRSVTLHPSPQLALERIAPGGSRSIGWLRLKGDTEVRAHVDTPASTTRVAGTAE